MRPSTLLLALGAISSTLALPTTSPPLEKRSNIIFGFITALYCEAPLTERITHAGPAKCYNLPANYSGQKAGALGLKSDWNDGCKIEPFVSKDCQGQPGVNGQYTVYTGAVCWVPGFLINSARVSC